MHRYFPGTHNCCLLGVLVLAVGWAPYVSAARPSDRQQPPFVIICFPGPPASDNRMDHYETIRRAHFNVVLPSYQYDDQQQLHMLDHCRATGLQGVVNVKRLAPPVSEGPPPENWKDLVEQAVTRFGNHPALYGYMIRDEPSAAAFPQLSRVADAFRQLDPNHDICVNLFPLYASEQQLGVPRYDDYLQQFLSTVKPPALCYDHYPFMRSGDDRRDFFQNLEVARRACRKSHTPLWIVVLCSWWQHFRTPTDGELRWQAYGALTYGIRGIGYFTFWPVKEDHVAAVDYRGTPQQPLYASIQQLNKELMVLGTRLASLQSVAVYHCGAQIPAGCHRLPDDGWLQLQGQPPVAVGQFAGEGAERYVLITNRNSKRSETVTMRTPGDVGDLLEIDSSTGALRRLAGQDHHYQVTLPAGTGRLLRLQ